MQYGGNVIKVNNLKVGRIAASEADVIEGRIVDQKAALRLDACLNAANAGLAGVAVVAPVTPAVANTTDLEIVDGAPEANVVDRRVVSFVVIRADFQLEGIHVTSARAVLKILEIAGAAIISFHYVINKI